MTGSESAGLELGSEPSLSKLAPAKLRRARARRRRVRWWSEACGLVCILLLATALRFYHLDSLPSGMTGDEGSVGLEARRILFEGSIGPYSPAALGQAAGPIYLVALVQRWHGESVWTVRCISALFGVLSVLALWLLLRRQAGRSDARFAALCGALLLATLNWSVLFSRIGFPLGTWPFMGLLAALPLLEARRRRGARGELWWWALAGGGLGLGFHAYNAHPLFVLIVAAFAGWELARDPGPLRRRMACGGLFLIGCLLTAAPLLLYALREPGAYLGHARGLSVFRSHEWETVRDTPSQIRFLLGRYLVMWRSLAWPLAQDHDLADGTGIAPAAPLFVLAFALGGVPLAWRDLRSRRRLPASFLNDSAAQLARLSLMVCLLMPISIVFTVTGTLRRPFVMAPFLVALAALGVARLWRWLRRITRANLLAGSPREIMARGMASTVCAVLLSVLATAGWWGYFKVYAGSEEDRWAFCEDLTQSAYWMNTVPPGTRILFFSDRWSANYETLRYLAPNAYLENRSREYAPAALRGSLSLPPEAPRCAFVLLGDYEKMLPELVKRYPGGQVTRGAMLPKTPVQWTFVAYLLPARPRRLPGNPSTTSAQ